MAQNKLRTRYKVNFADGSSELLPLRPENEYGLYQHELAYIISCLETCYTQQQIDTIMNIETVLVPIKTKKYDLIID